MDGDVGFFGTLAACVQPADGHPGIAAVDDRHPRRPVCHGLHAGIRPFSGERRRGAGDPLLRRAAGRLACLDATAGEVVERSCEKILFATPETVAAAVSYVAARLSLLADGMDYAERVDKSYTMQMEGMRRALETDRFGLVAHVLKNRDGCTAEQCPVFSLLRDKSRVSANLIGDPFEGFVKRHAAAWEERSMMPAGGTAAPAPATLAQTPVPAANPPSRVSSRWDFPSAKSIPPVSIMDPEPAGPAPKPAQTQDAAGTPPKPARTAQPAAPRPPISASASPRD